MNQSPRPKNTPGRRRQGRNGNNNNGSTPQKSYVSENDLPAYLSGGAEQQFVNPNTPLKAPSAQKPRSRNNKNRNKNGSPPHQNKHSNPQAIPIEAPAAIFAGATFHASPAPSSLPMPSFLARSSAESPLAKSSPLAQARASPQQEPSPPSTDSEGGQGLAQLSEGRNNDSPLEVFFRAQRAEKAKGHRAKSANAATPTFAPGPFSPPQASPMAARTVPRGQSQIQAQTFANAPKSAGPGISAIELDGTPGRGLGPAFSTPYAERIRAARPSPAVSNANNTADPASHYDESQALLRMLHHGKPAFGQSPPAAQPQQQQHQHQQQYYHSSPQDGPGAQSAFSQYRQPMPYQQYSSHQVQPPYQNSPYSFSPPAQSNGISQLKPQHGAVSDGDQISKMEASLRQVLKLDSSS
ncbi:uncharacterized protein B0I36DRAFT_359629 [Microdochium trichocladiopsis]|uniref:Proteophosphoglycan 5 n=1 Tax=Microdochium trichocladiopsis TaxID=1682393 RepID=A0A9P8YFK6_9PEZI|nr:uncharacterized protein B0I36DRAFT_359629 [Microdochium trichocladiopsis]KAH7038017.1 hypothetical protein B0I36DRAFT_359629 [Microdochium trichocladiopsis]